MKLTHSILKNLIKEELQNLLQKQDQITTEEAKKPEKRYGRS